MTGPQPDTESDATRPISVAELLARNGTIGAPAVTRRRRRRRGDSDSVTVAELTGEIPIIRDEDLEPPAEQAEPEPESPPVPEPAPVDETPAEDITGETGTEPPKAAYWSEPEPRWPKSPPQPTRATGPERSEYPRPVRQPAASEADTAAKSGQSGAEGMSPDPVDNYSDIPVDVMDSEVRDAEAATEDSAYVRSYLSDSALLDDDEPADGSAAGEELQTRTGSAADIDEDRADDEAQEAHSLRDRFSGFWRGSVVVFQSVLAVAFGAGLFVAFDELWRWNSIVALVLSVLVILGLVAGVRVVRKTEDIASTLIAVAVGALITLGPLALSLQSG